MTHVSNIFIKHVGKPESKVKPGFTFKQDFDQLVWDSVISKTGCGWFLDGFIYLFGEGLDKLEPCLDAWSFLLPDKAHRQIIGRNAYGSLLVIEGQEKNGTVAQLGILDPLRCMYWQPYHLSIMNLVGLYLPEKNLPGFLDDRSVYDFFHKAMGSRLELDEMLAIKVPLMLDGEMSPGNFQVENMIEYYQTTAPIYRKALKK